MDTPSPFCQDCGSVGVMLSGMHPGDGGVVRWTIYRCGHTHTEILFDDVPEDEASDLVRATPQTA